VIAILSDLQPPFLKGAAVALSGRFEPLWSPADLPVRVGSTEQGLEWSRGMVGELLERKPREEEAGLDEAAAPAVVVTAAGRPV
jgi:hypothetical protein